MLGVSDSPVRVAAVRRIGRVAASDTDLVAAEEPLAIEIEHGAPGARASLNLGIVLRTPGSDEDLVTGLLFAEGFIRQAADIDRIDAPSPGHLRLSLNPSVEFP